MKFLSCILSLMVILSNGTALAGVSAARGEYLVEGLMGCGNCHTPIGASGFIMEQNLGGRLVEDIDAFTAYAPNITPYSRIVTWSDAELSKAIREGIRPDGSIIGPPMPFASYRYLSDNDLASVVMYLRSVPEVINSVPKSKYRIPLPPAYGPPLIQVNEPMNDISAQHGEYIAMAAHCMECHSPMGPKGVDWKNSFGKGGMEFHGPWGVSVSSNITNHRDGLADYSDQEIKVMVTQGKRPDGSDMLPPMPYSYLSKMNPVDLEALVLYLRQLPALASE